MLNICLLLEIVEPFFMYKFECYIKCANVNMLFNIEVKGNNATIEKILVDLS